MERVPKYLILDVDGVLTDGRFYYTQEGKVMKVFGPDDNDALSLLKPHMEICAVTGDRKGFPITKKRVAEDMKLRLEPASTFERVKWMEENGFALEDVVYMGDGIFDAAVFDRVGYAIAPANAFFTTKARADFVTTAAGGQGAVAEACVHLLEKFFTPFDPGTARLNPGEGEWGIVSSAI